VVTGSYSLRIHVK